MYYKMKEIPESIDFIIVKRNTEALIEDIETAIGKALGLTNEDEKLPFTIYTRNYLAKELVKEGYRKVGEDCVVLTREEYTNYMVEYMGVKEIKDRVRKETAREILQELYDEAMRYTNEIVKLSALQIKQLAKEKGIELE